jgi:threonine/homoserine/homoserine lactone efflux protein
MGAVVRDRRRVFGGGLEAGLRRAACHGRRLPGRPGNPQPDRHAAEDGTAGRVAGWRTGLITSAANPKLAVFFLALLPQFLARGSAVLPTAVLMSLVIVACDVVWFSTLAWLVDRAGRAVRPRLRRTLERMSGAALLGVGVRVAAQTR